MEGGIVDDFILLQFAKVRYQAVFSGLRRLLVDVFSGVQSQENFEIVGSQIRFQAFFWRGGGR